ncbi:MAG: hypothetical protein K2H18_02860 [Muribaculaceae bacterium]|nr:hypothetical protein [Muribaculaceae bacterium]
MMRKELIFSAVLASACYIVADTLPDGNRMIINHNDGRTEVMVVDSIESMTFITIPESKALISVTSNDDASVQGTVDMTAGCKRYQVVCEKAADWQEITDAEKHIMANHTIESATPGFIDFIDLDPSTEYTIATLSYDEYDLPCEVMTQNFTTSAPEECGPAYVGDYLYRDGTWSSELKRTKTPVGIVFSTSLTEADKALGYQHGYAVAFKEIPSIDWTVEADENESGATFSSANDGDVNDQEGLSHTLELLKNADVHPAARLTREYAPAPEGTSGWFIPSTGQMIDIFCNLGGIERDAYTRSASGVAEWSMEDGAAAISALNARFAVAGENNFTPVSTYTWTSTERSVMATYYIYAHPNYNLSIQSYNKDSKFAVRPVIAF